MTTRATLIVCAALMLAFAAGCAGGDKSAEQGAEGQQGPGGEGGGDVQTGPLAVTSPEEGAWVTGDTLTVTGQALSADILRVEVNTVGADVVNGAFSATIPVVAEGGQMVITVRGGGMEAQRRVMVDSGAPSIVIESPARGAFLVKGTQDSILVRGKVTDPGGVDKVLVNGVAATMDAQGGFSASVTPSMGVNVVKVEATDGGGKKATDTRAVVYGDFAPWGQPTYDAIGGRISAEGLDMIADAVSDKLGPELLAGLDLGGMGGTEEFALRGLDISGIEVDLVPLDGALRTTLRIYGLDIDFDAQFNGNDISGNIDADPAEMIMNIHLDADGLGGLDIAFSEADVELHNFDFDVGGLLGLVDWILKGTIEKEIEKAIIEYMSTFVMEDVLTADTLTQTAEILGLPAEFQLLITELSVDAGGITFSTDAALNTQPGPNTPSSPGSFSTPSPAPSGSGSEDLRFSIADDFLNQLFGSLWRAGALEINLGEALGGLSESGVELPLKFDVGTLAGLTNSPALLEYATPETPVGILLKSNLPPIVTLEEGADKPLKIAMAEVNFEFMIDLPEGQKHWATIATHMFIEIGMSPEEGEVGLAIGLEAMADVVEEPLFPLDQPIAEAALVSILELLPGLLTGDALGDAFDMGTVAEVNPGLGLGGFELALGGPQSDFLSFLVDLTIDVAPQEAPELDVLTTAVNPDNGHTYALLESSSWSDAEAFARKLGGHLVTIRNRDENSWIIDTFGSWGDQNRDMWIGLHDVGHEGEFTWVSGEPVEFTRWADDPDNGREDDQSNYNEDFVLIYGDDSERRDERWNDFKDKAIAPWSGVGIHGLVEIIPDAPQPDEGN